MSIINCPDCGNKVSTMAGTCPTCGVSIRGHLIKCDQCGAYYLDHESQCPQCGAAVTKTAPEPDTTQSSEPTTTPQPEKKRGKGRIFLRAAGVTFALIVLGSLAVGGYYHYHVQQDIRLEQKRFAELERLSDPRFFEQFLQDFPNSVYKDNVQKRLNVLNMQQKEWEMVVTGNREALQKFLEKYPNSYHVRQCEQLIDSMDWQDALADTTGKGIDRYLEQHPEGHYADLAAQRKNELAKTSVSLTEKSMIRGTLDIFFNNVMQSADTVKVAQVIVQPMESFCGKKGATAQDVMQYMEQKKGKDVIGIHYTVANVLNVRRESLSDGTLGYHVECTVDETVSRSDTSKPANKCYNISCRMTADRRVIQMSIK